jgi:Ribosomal protein S10p/S20e
MNKKNNIFIRSCNSIRCGSYKKKNLRSLCEQLIYDLNMLADFLHKIIYFKYLSHKFQLISFFLSCSFSFLPESLYAQSFFSFLYSFYRISTFCWSFQYKKMISNNFFFLFYSSYYYYMLSYFLFFNFLIFFNFKNKGVVSLPTQRSRYTVLRSPHIDKKSREQFELKRYVRLFQYPSVFYEYYNYLLLYHYDSFLCSNLHCVLFFKHDYI